MQDLSRGNIQQEFAYRSRDEVARFFAGLDLMEPGIVPLQDWRPEPGAANPGASAMWCAVGRKP
jgi:hypothetical protein